MLQFMGSQRSPLSPPDRDRRGDYPAWSGRGRIEFFSSRGQESQRLFVQQQPFKSQRERNPINVINYLLAQKSFRAEVCYKGKQRNGVAPGGSIGLRSQQMFVGWEASQAYETGG